MSDWKTIQNFTEEQEKSLARLRWLQVKTLKEQYPNDQELGAKVRELVNNTN